MSKGSSDGLRVGEVSQPVGGITEAMLDEAAKRLAVSLMRLCEALEYQDAQEYSTIPRPNGKPSPRWRRETTLRHHYRQWFSLKSG